MLQATIRGSPAKNLFCIYTAIQISDRRPRGDYRAADQLTGRRPDGAPQSL